MKTNYSRIVSAYLIAIIIGIIFKGFLNSPIAGLVVIAFIPFVARFIGYPLFEVSGD